MIPDLRYEFNECQSVSFSFRQIRKKRVKIKSLVHLIRFPMISTIFQDYSHQCVFSLPGEDCIHSEHSRPAFSLLAYYFMLKNIDPSFHKLFEHQNLTRKGPQIELLQAYHCVVLPNVAYIGNVLGFNFSKNILIIYIYGLLLIDSSVKA